MRYQALMFVFIASFFALFHVTSAAAQSSPTSVVIVGEGMKGASISLPTGQIVPIRLEGQDKDGKPVLIDTAKIVWRVTGGRSFAWRQENGQLRIRAKRDAFDAADGKEPEGMIFATYGALTAGVKIYSSLYVVGKWRISVHSDKIDVNIVRQSGRWVVDDKGQKGEINGRTLTLHIWADLRVFGRTEVWPYVSFTSRTTGTGKVYVNALVGTEKFTITKVE
jgi:hypothetical protein